MEDDFDSGLDISDPVDTADDPCDFDVGAMMDEAPDVAEMSDFSDLDGGDESFDVGSFMDSSAMDTPEPAADIPPVEDAPPEIPETYEPDFETEELPEETEIPAELPVEETPEVVVEDIPAETEPEDAIPVVAHPLEDEPSEEALVEDVPVVTPPVEDVPIEETPVEDVPVEETPVEDIPVEETPVEDVPIEETPVEDVPVEETPVEDVPVEETPVEDIPVEETPVEDVPMEDTPVEDVPMGDTPVEDVPVEETPVEDVPVEDIPVEETPVEDVPMEDTPVEDVPVEDIPVEKTPVEDVPVEETPVEDVPVEATPAEDAAAETAPATEDVRSPYGPGPAQSAMTDYMCEHNYGPDDYETYSRDPEWQRLNNDFLQETGREPIDYTVQETEAVPEYDGIGPGPAQSAMTDYMCEHNYGPDDYETYSRDPEWQRLNNDFLQETGREPIDYTAQETVEEVPNELPPETPPVTGETADVTSDKVPDVTVQTVPDAVETTDTAVPTEKPERVLDEFETTIAMDDEDFYESGTFYTQGINEYGYTGTCGETSMASTMNRVLGTNEYTENKVLDVAVQEGLCDTSSFDDSGGTTTDQFMELYDRMNETCGNRLDVELTEYGNVLTMEEAAERLEDGCTLNVAVDSRTLWDETDPMGGPAATARATDHWITVTGVQRNDDGSIRGFDIIDSGGGVDYVDADKYEAMCYGTDRFELTDPTCIVVSRADGAVDMTAGSAADVGDAVKTPAFDRNQELYEQYESCPEDSDRSFDLMREIYKIFHRK